MGSARLMHNDRRRCDRPPRREGCGGREAVPEDAGREAVFAVHATAEGGDERGGMTCEVVG